MSDDEPITRAFLRMIAQFDERVELPSDRLLELLDAEAEQDRLRETVATLARFADHLDGCAVHANHPCDCGLDDALGRPEQRT